MKPLFNFWNNKELRCYYLQHFCNAISSVGGARFSMSYFFLFGGITIVDVVLTIIAYAISALIALYPVS